MSTTDHTPMTLVELIRGVRGDLRRAFAALVAFEVLFRALVAVVFLPSMAILLFSLVRWSGRTALTNEDILSFVLSPWGVLYGFLLGLKALGVALLEHAGIIAIAALKQSGHWHGFRHAMIILAGRTLRVLRLTALLLAVAALVVAPFAGLAALTYNLLLGQQDINYYLADRPPRFYVACGIGGVLLLGALGVLAALYVRWVFALCVVLMEDRTPIPALGVSAERTRGIRWRIGLVLLAWQLLGIGLQLLVLGAFRLAAGWALTGVGNSPRAVLPVVVTLLVLHALVAAVVAAFTVAIHCLLILRMYVHRGLRVGALDAQHWGDALDVEPSSPRRALIRLEWGVACVVVLFCILTLALSARLGVGEKIEVTAHRGYWRSAPENSLAAIQQAIEVGADWAEIDVQLTRDGQIVLLHDADLKRMTGDSRRLLDLDVRDLRQLPFLPRYGGKESDRVPTLREAVEVARGKIKLNIELKFSGRDRELASKVAQFIAENEYEEECFVSSLTYEGVVLAKRHNDRLRTAAIVTASVGDISRLDVDILSISRNQATDDLLRKAKRLGKEIHVWTVNDRATMRRLLDRGVQNIITDDPQTFLELRKEHDELADGQKLLMACRHLLQ